MQFRFSIVVATTALAAGTALAQSPAPLAPERLFERVSPSVWGVKTFDDAGRPIAAGSAVVIGPGSLVTNCHVLTRARKVSVTRENVAYGATLEHPDTVRDLCLLKVANFTAPAVTIAPNEELKIGSRVYAIGNPRELETTISDGLLSGIRKSDTEAFTALQVTVPISAGSSGGGLFDTQGRLIGITTFTLKDSQNLNFALPASWIAEVPARAAAALSARNDRTTVASTPLRSDKSFFEYRLRDRTSGISQSVVYRLDRVEGDQLSFNQGTRVEKEDGRVVALRSAIAGEYEMGMPPGGWITPPLQRGATWQVKYENNDFGQRIAMDLTARASEESTMRIGSRELRIIRVEFTGYTVRTLTQIPGSGRYTANVWFAPDIGRVVRFDAKTRGGISTGAFLVDEILELVDTQGK